MCAYGPTGQAATGSAVRKIHATGQEDFRGRTTKTHKLLIFAMKMKCWDVMRTAQVNLYSGFIHNSPKYTGVYE